MITTVFQNILWSNILKCSFLPFRKNVLFSINIRSTLYTAFTNANTVCFCGLLVKNNYFNYKSNKNKFGKDFTSNTADVQIIRHPDHGWNRKIWFLKLDKPIKIKFVFGTYFHGKQLQTQFQCFIGRLLFLLWKYVNFF